MHKWNNFSLQVFSFYIGTRKKSRQKIRGGRISEVGFASETSVSEEAAVIGPSGKRIGQVDQVVKAPERFNGSSALVVIRSFCRFAPLESDAPHCRKPEPLYFYNVTSAACEPFYGGHCQRSRNRFRNVPDCLKVKILRGIPKLAIGHYCSPKRHWL